MKALLTLTLCILSLHAFSQAKVTAIRAKLFYNENKEFATKDVSGSFSPNIIDNGEFALWNTIIGEGSAEGASNQTIVIVEISAKGMSNKSQIIKLTTTIDKKTQSQQQTFSCIDCTKPYKVLFILNNTGCDPIKLKAELLNNNKVVSTLTKNIDFQCGE